MKKFTLILVCCLLAVFIAPAQTDTVVAVKKTLSEKQILRKLGVYGNRTMAKAIAKSEDPQQKLAEVVKCLRVVREVAREGDEFYRAWTHVMSAAAANATTPSGKASFGEDAKFTTRLSLWQKMLKGKPALAASIVRHPRIVSSLADRLGMNFFVNIDDILSDEDLRRAFARHPDTLALIITAGRKDTYSILNDLRDPLVAMAFDENTAEITTVCLAADPYATIALSSMSKPGILKLTVTDPESVAACYRLVAQSLTKHGYLYSAPTPFDVLNSQHLKIDSLPALQNWSQMMVRILQEFGNNEAARVWWALTESGMLYAFMTEAPDLAVSGLRKFNRYRQQWIKADREQGEGSNEHYPVTDFFHSSFADRECAAAFSDYCRGEKSFRAMMSQFIKKAFILKRKSEGQWRVVGTATVKVVD